MPADASAPSSMRTEASPTLRLSVSDLLRYVARGLVPALLVALVVAGAVYFLARNPAPVYQSVAILLATRPASGYGSTNVLAPPQVDPGIYRAAVLEGPLLGAALSQVLGGEVDARTLEAWHRDVKVRTEDSLVSSLVRIEVDDADPTLAARLANVLAEGLLAWDRNRVNENVAASVRALERAVVLLGVQLSAAEAAGDDASVQALRLAREQRIADLNAARALSYSAAAIGLLEPFRTAMPASEPINDRTTQNVAIAFVIAFLLTYAILVARWSSDTRVRSLADVEAATGIAPEVLVPRRSSRAAEGFEHAMGWLHVRLRPADLASGVVHVVTCPRDAREKADIVVPIAETLAASGYRVLLVDADMEDATTTRRLGLVPNSVTSLERALLAPQEAHRPAHIVTDMQTGFDVIPSFRRLVGAVPLLDMGFRELVASWRSTYDVILVDTPPMLPVPDTRAIVELVDSVLLVAAMGRTQAADLREARALLTEASGTRIRTVLVEPLRTQRERARARASVTGATQAAERTAGSQRVKADVRTRSSRR